MVHLEHILDTLGNVLAQSTFSISVLVELARQQLHLLTLHMHALTLSNVDAVDHLTNKKNITYSLCCGRLLH
jgi:hypothetical protein